MATTAVRTATDLTEVIEGYLRAWNSDDPDERTALLERTVTDNVVFVDPMTQRLGRDALAEHIANVRETYPGLTFAAAGDVDEHNNVLRVPWRALIDDQVAVSGLDVDDIGVDGRLTRIVGFFDKT
jgi:hypothetical protein